MLESGEEEISPGVVGLVVQAGGAWWAVVAGAYQPQADCPGLPGAGGGGGQGEQLGEGQQVTGQGHVQASDTVLREALQGEVVEPGVFCAADAVPWRRARSRWRALSRRADPPSCWVVKAVGR